MRIGLIAPPWVPVPPRRYGGTEQVVDDLARGLVRLGQDVRLFTVGSSTCPVPRDWLFDAPAEPMNTTAPEAAHVLAAYEALTDVDVVHDHTTLGPLLRQAGEIPVVATNHNAFTPALRRVYAEVARSAAVVAISRSQRRSAPEIPVAAVILHGVDLNRYPYGEGRGEFLLFIGRMCAEKGVHRAIAVARASGRRLVVVTKLRAPDEWEYYDRVVRPLQGPDVDLRVEIPTAERIALLQSAAALINPIAWPEPFGLVMAEALACGTPVLAFPQGAAPEIVEDGRTGFLCVDEEAMAERLTRLHRIDRRTCRAVAEERFGADRMAADHLRLYERVLAAGASADRWGGTVTEMSAAAGSRRKAAAASANRTASSPSA